MRVKLDLNADYKTTGNSSEMQIDALSIAVTGEDYNGLTDYNWDYISQVETEAAKDYVNSGECEDAFVATLTPERALYFKEHLDEYDTELETYRDELLDIPFYDLPDDHPLAKAVQEARDYTERDMRKDWIYGDYHGNFDGIIPEAVKYWSDYLEDIDYDEKKDVLYATVNDEQVQALKDDGYITRKTEKAVRDAISGMISSRAVSQHSDRVRKREASREERERVAAYQKKQKEEHVKWLNEKKLARLDSVIKK